MEDPQFRTADGSAIRIWTDPAENPFASEKQGRPIYDECTYVEVIAPGSKGSSPVFEVERIFHESVGHPPYRSPQYAQYAEQIKAYQEKTNATDLRGTPLKEWPEISRSMAASLKASDIFTVEALAGLPDSRLNVVGPDGRTWRTKAQAWLDSTKDSGVATALAAKLEHANEQITRLQAQVAELQAGATNQMAPEAIQAATQTPPALPPPPAAPPPPKAPPKAPKPAPLPSVADLAPGGQNSDTVPAASTLSDIV